MRNAFIDELVKIAYKNKNIALIVGDLGYSVVEPFADNFPDRFINAGIAEQNMTSLAAGMASEGYHVFTYSIANFPTFRCAEQIRNDIDYHNLPVTIVSVGGGLAYGALGYSHHAVQDYGLMRSMPNMLIAAPGDPLEVRSCLRYIVKNPCPSYLRLGKAGEKSFHLGLPDLKPGEWKLIKKGKEKKKSILCTGATIDIALGWQNSKNYQDYNLYSLPLWSMKSKNLQINYIKNLSSILTVEDHLLDCGFGSWIREAASLYNNTNCLIQSKYLDESVCGLVGQQATLNKEGGLVFE